MLSRIQQEVFSSYFWMWLSPITEWWFDFMASPTILFSVVKTIMTPSAKAPETIPAIVLAHTIVVVLVHERVLDHHHILASTTYTLFHASSTSSKAASGYSCTDPFSRSLSTHQPTGVSSVLYEPTMIPFHSEPFFFLTRSPIFMVGLY